MSELPTFSEFLISLSIITSAEAFEMVGLSNRIGMSLGELLLGCKKMSARQLSLLSQVYALLLDCVVDSDKGLGLAKECLDTQCSVESLYEKYGVDKNRPRYRLGDLLVACEVIEASSLTTLLDKSSAMGKPLGHILIESRVITPDVVAAALNCQNDIRFKGEDSAAAIAALRASINSNKVLVDR
jgi:hypothetical protein